MASTIIRVSAIGDGIPGPPGPPGPGDMILGESQIVTAPKMWNVGTLLDKGSVIVNVVAFGASVSNSAASNDSAITEALASMTTGVLYFPATPGDAFDHTGITLKSGVAIMCAGNGATTLNNTHTGGNPNVYIPPLANRCAVWDVQLTGVAGSGDGILIEDAYSCKTNCRITGWGNSKAGIRMDTVSNPGGNGTYFTEIFAPEINGLGRTGAIGILATGTAAGTNAAKLYGGWITNCPDAGVDIDVGDTFDAYSPSINGCGTGVRIGGETATNSRWMFPRMEGNTTHFDVETGSFAHSFIFPTLSSPTVFGTDNGIATQILSMDSSIVGSKLAGTLDLSGRFRATAYGVLSSPSLPVAVSTSVVTVTSTTSETTLKSFTVPANSLAVGDIVDIEISGTYTTTVGTETFALFLNIQGGNLPTAISSTVGVVTDAPFKWIIRCIVTAAGGAGTVEVSSWGHINGLLKTHNPTATQTIGNTGSDATWIISVVPSAITATIKARQYVMKVTKI